MDLHRLQRGLFLNVIKKRGAIGEMAPPRKEMKQEGRPCRPGEPSADHCDRRPCQLNVPEGPSTNAPLSQRAHFIHSIGRAKPVLFGKLGSRIFNVSLPVMEQLRVTIVECSVMVK